MSSTLGSLVVSLEANITKFQSDMGRAAQVAESAMAKVSRSAEIAKVALGGLGAALSIGGFAEMIMKTVESTAALKEMAAKSGATAESLSAMRKVAKESGTDMDGVVTGMQKLAKHMVEAQEGTGKSAASFQKLGLSVTDSTGRLKGTDQMLFEVAKRMDEYRDGAGKTALMQELMGKSGANLALFLEMLAQKHELLATRTTAQVEQAEKFRIALVRIGEEVEKFKASLVLGMLPTLEKSIPLFKLAATLAIEFFAAFILGPKIIAVAAAAFEAVSIAIGTARLQFALASMEVASGTSVWAILNTTLWGTGIAAEWAAGMLGKFKIVAGVLFAGVAGWQIGTYLREQFVEADLAGIALVEGLTKAWEWMKYGFTAAVESMKSLFYGFISGVGGALSHVPGFGASAPILAQLGASGGQQSKLAIAQAAAERDRNIADNASIFGEMADAAIDRHQVASASASSKKDKPDIPAGLGDNALDALRKQIEGRIQMLERANASEKLLMGERQSMLQHYYQTDQISLFDYYAGRQVAQEAALAHTLDNFQKEITAWQQYQRHYQAGSKEYVDAANKIAEIRGKITIAEQEGANQTTQDWLQQQQAIKQYTNKLTDLQAKLAEMRGDKGLAAGIQFDLGNQPFVNQLQAIASSTTASVDEIARARQALADIAVLKARAIENAATDWQSGANRALRAYAEAGSAAAQAGKLFSDAFKGVEDSIVSIATDSTGSIKKMLDAGKSHWVAYRDAVKDSFKGLANSIITDLIRIQVQQSIMKPLVGTAESPGILSRGLSSLASGAGNALSDLFGGGRASGGSVNPGQYYVVGENGPEILVPGTSGTVIPSGTSGSAASPISVTLNYKIDSRTDQATIAMMMARAKQDTLAAIGDAQRRGR